MAHRCLSIVLFILLFYILFNISAINGKRKSMCEECGIPVLEPKIMGGTQVENKGKYPWIVNFREVKNINMTYCGGVLISASFVLTAAHCVDDPDKRDLDDCKAPLPEECARPASSIKIGVLVHPRKEIIMRKKVKRIIVHPEYNQETNVHDIALVQFQRTMDCLKMARPICLPYKDMSEINQTLIISGWGKYDDKMKLSPQVLMEGTVNQVNETECLSPMSEDRHIICARGMESNQASCQGDSGSSIFMKGEGIPQYYAIGITSEGPEDCDSKEPDSYSDVFHYLKWIKSHVKDLPMSRNEIEEKAKQEKSEERRKKK